MRKQYLPRSLKTKSFIFVISKDEMIYNEKGAKKNWYMAIYYPVVEDEDSYYDNDVLKHRNKMSVLS